MFSKDKVELKTFGGTIFARQLLKFSFEVRVDLEEPVEGDSTKSNLISIEERFEGLVIDSKLVRQSFPIRESFSVSFATLTTRVPQIGPHVVPKDANLGIHPTILKRSLLFRNDCIQSLQPCDCIRTATPEGHGCISSARF
jgi:hypothetical protein